MNVSAKIIQSLRILGLSPGATAAEIRSAFRRLARTCHPDVAGRQGARKFEQVAGAYTFLKGLSQEELYQSVATPPPSAGKKKGSRIWRNPLAWSRKKKESSEAENAAQQHSERVEAERLEEAEARRHKARVAAVELVLSRGERTVDAFIARMEEEMRSCDTQDLVLRLTSELPEVRHLALSRLGRLANERRILDTLATLLRRWEIDEKTARLVALLPLDPESRSRLIRDLLGKVRLPDPLLSFLLQLHAEPLDRELLERYLLSVESGGATPSGISLVLRHWPPKAPIPAPVLRVLLAQDDEAVLVPVLGMMKQRAIPCPTGSAERLKALFEHPNVAVRVWSKAIAGVAASAGPRP